MLMDMEVMRMSNTDMLINYIHRLLTDSPHVHHAVHLATIRKEVATAPRSILRAFRYFKAPPPAPDNVTEKKKESSYDNIDEDQRDSSSGGGYGGEKKSWLPSFGRSKASKFVVDGNK